MTPSERSLFHMTAGELMSRNVVMIPREMSLSCAARLLNRAQVSGAPVVDTEGRCVGVLSSMDYVRWAQEERPPRETETQHCSAWSIVENGTEAVALVEQVMNWDPVLVTPQVSIGALARMMVDAHIHRVIVVDEQTRPIGVVSAMDLLAAVAQADLVHETESAYHH